MLITISSPVLCDMTSSGNSGEASFLKMAMEAGVEEKTDALFSFLQDVFLALMSF